MGQGCPTNGAAGVRLKMVDTLGGNLVLILRHGDDKLLRTTTVKSTAETFLCTDVRVAKEDDTTVLQTTVRTRIHLCPQPTKRTISSVRCVADLALRTVSFSEAQQSQLLVSCPAYVIAMHSVTAVALTLTIADAKNLAIKPAAGSCNINVPSSVTPVLFCGMSHSDVRDLGADLVCAAMRRRSWAHRIQLILRDCGVQHDSQGYEVCTARFELQTCVFRH